MSTENNNIDSTVDQEIYDCLNLDQPKSFFLFAGAGSGKTRSLVNVLERFKTENGRKFRQERKKVAVITYTNAASDEIKHRLNNDPIFHVSTIHSFVWDLIKPFNQDIKNWIKKNLDDEIAELEKQQSKSRDLSNKTSVDRARKIKSKTLRLESLDKIIKFTYNPNGDNLSKDSLNHSEVLKIASDFILKKELMQQLVTTQYPILLIDESQDTKKELIDAFFELQAKRKGAFSLGLFGDTMQRIYSDGKENLGVNLPEDFVKPEKRMNHRSNKRIINLINSIREDVDGQNQIPRVEKEEGYARLFICERGLDKKHVEQVVSNRMAEITGDTAWKTEEGSEIKTLILEHHMAAVRMGFLDFFEPLYKESKLSTGLLEGTLSGANFFRKIILPLVNANTTDDKFEIARIVKQNSYLLRKKEILESDKQSDNIDKVNDAVKSLLSLWKDDSEPSLVEILKNVHSTGLFPIPDDLLIIANRTERVTEESENSEEEDRDDIIDAWDKALKSPFSQVKNYNEYLLETSKFGTHQGVKGLEYPRVMVILDDEEARGFLFSYDKLFGAKGLSKTDKDNIAIGRETGIDRTKRLFYVACSRAKDSLAVIAYTNSVETIKETAIHNGWFKEDEIEIINQ